MSTWEHVQSPVPSPFLHAAWVWFLQVHCPTLGWHAVDDTAPKKNLATNNVKTAFTIKLPLLALAWTQLFVSAWGKLWAPCPGTGTSSKGGTRWYRHWSEEVHFPCFFLMLPCDTVNKMAGAKLTNENMAAPWAPRGLNILFSDQAKGPSTGT